MNGIHPTHMFLLDSIGLDLFLRHIKLTFCLHHLLKAFVSFLFISSMNWALHFCSIYLDVSSLAFTQLSGSSGTPDIAPSSWVHAAAWGSPIPMNQQNHSCVNFSEHPGTQPRHLKVLNPLQMTLRCSQLQITASSPSSPKVDVSAKYNCFTVVQ